jgi:hypothetical protein
MKKAIGIGIALCIMMSLVVVLAGAGEEDKAKDVVVQWKGTGTYVGNTSGNLSGYLAGLVPTGDEKCVAIFKVNMFDPTTGRCIGTGYDYITDLGEGDVLTNHSGVVTTCYIFDFSRSGHGAIISKNNVTIQPALGDTCGSLECILGSFPDEDTIKGGTGKYKHVEGGCVRVSGGVNLTSMEFDHLFVITLDKGKSK